VYFVEKTKGLNKAKRFDYMLFFAVLLVTSIGIAAVYSATRRMPGNVNGNRMMITQITGLMIGLISAFVFCLMDYKDLKSLGYVFYAGTIILLIAVIFFGVGENIGSRSWLRIGGVSFQPSELAKIALIIVVSIYFEKIRDENYTTKDIIKLIIYASLPMVFILGQKDFGTLIVFVVIIFIMVFICGLPYKYLTIMGGAFVASLPILWFFVLNDKRKARIWVFLKPEADPMGEGYNVLKSKIAIGSGQLWGQGLTKGLQTQNMGVPVRESDFIFTVIGEELGFIGCSLVIILLFFILFKCLYIAANASDSYGMFLVTGVTGYFAFHIFENIGMTLGLLPVTGVPLPFVSHGATSMIANYMGIGLVLSVSMRRHKTIFNDD